MDVREVLTRLKDGKITVEEAELHFRRQPFEELGYAKLDTHRKMRSGFPEVIFCMGKADKHLLEIVGKLYEAEGEVMGTRATKEQYEMLKESYPDLAYDELSRIIKIEKRDKKHIGCITVCTAGTADIAVAEEAAQVAEYFGAHV